MLPPDWSGQDTDFSRFSSLLPSQMVPHPIEKGIECNTYFYVPPRGDFSRLNQFAARNKSSVGHLLVEFFRYYTWDFDFHSHVISVRVGGVLSKEEKAEMDCWHVNSRLSIEDPFETWYNVSHFLKQSRQDHIRMEFARAYSLCCQEGQRLSSSSAGIGSLLEVLCEQAPLPPFLREEEEEEGEQPLEGATMGGQGLHQWGMGCLMASEC